MLGVFFRGGESVSNHEVSEFLAVETQELRVDNNIGLVADYISIQRQKLSIAQFSQQELRLRHSLRLSFWTTFSCWYSKVSAYPIQISTRCCEVSDSKTCRTSLGWPQLHSAMS
jgi:hypothetical protein